MGRGTNELKTKTKPRIAKSNINKVAKKRGRPTKVETYTEQLNSWNKLIMHWERISRVNDAQNKKDHVAQQQAKARALVKLQNDSKAQVDLIRVAQFANKINKEFGEGKNFEEKKLIHTANAMSSRAKELFILCHTGYIENFITPHINRFDNAKGNQTYSSIENIREDLRIAAQTGLHDGIDRFDCEGKNKPMTYMRYWMHYRLTGEVERMAKISRAKGKTTDLVGKIEAASKQIADEGRQITLAEISKITGIPVNRVAEVHSLATKAPVRLDAPVSTDEGSASYGDMMVDPSQNVEDPVMDSSEKEWMEGAISRLDNDLYKTVLRQYYGIGDYISVPQNVLYDGVYIDKKGKRYSAEPSVLKDKKRAARGETVKKEKQSVLNQRFKAGELVFEPGSAEAHQIARVAKDGLEALDKPFSEEYITVKTGVPPRSGTIQNAIKEATRLLQQMAVEDGMIEK